MENSNETVVTDRRSSFAIDEPKADDLPPGINPIAEEVILSDVNAVNLNPPAPRPKRVIVPWGERILVKPDPPEEFYSKEADIKRAEVNQEKALEGTVVWMGLAFDKSYAGPHGTDFLEIGDKVGYVKFTGAEFNEDDEEFLMLRPDEVLCVFLPSAE